MEFLEKLSAFFGKWMALIVIAVAALALFAPQTCLWIKTSWINWLLGIVMFGMGLTLKKSCSAGRKISSSALSRSLRSCRSSPLF